jgi:hypothetical protein
MPAESAGTVRKCAQSSEAFFIATREEPQRLLFHAGFGFPFLSSP